MFDPQKYVATMPDLHQLLDEQKTVHRDAGTEKESSLARSPIPRHEQGRPFIRGPIPCDWLQLALSLGGKAGNLSLSLWWLAGMQRTNPIRLTKSVLDKFSISTRTSRRLLLDFERAGLVLVTRKQGCSPMVTLKYPDQSNSVQEESCDGLTPPRTNSNGG